MYFWKLFIKNSLFYFGGGGGSSSSVASPVAATPAAATPIKDAGVTASVVNPFESVKRKKTTQYLGSTDDSTASSDSSSSQTLGTGASTVA
jgi:hypothetical protein